MCGALSAPSHIDVGGLAIKLTAVPGEADAYSLDPWPFTADELAFDIDARVLPQRGRFADQTHMRSWLADPTRVALHPRLMRRA